MKIKIRKRIRSKSKRKRKIRTRFRGLNCQSRDLGERRSRWRLPLIFIVLLILFLILILLLILIFLRGALWPPFARSSGHQRRAHGARDRAEGQGVICPGEAPLFNSPVLAYRSRMLVSRRIKVLRGLSIWTSRDEPAKLMDQSARCQILPADRSRLGVFSGIHALEGRAYDARLQAFPDGRPWDAGALA